MNQTQPSSQPQTGRRGCSGCFLRGMGVLGLLISLPVGLYLFLWGLGALLITSDVLDKPEMIVLLGGGDRQRWQEAVNLYKQEPSRRILITETGVTINDIGTRYSLLVRNNLSAMGVPMDNIRITNEIALSTLQEAKTVRDYLEYWGYKSAVVVTDPYHTFRTRLIFNDVFRGSPVDIRVRAVQGHWYRSADWMFSRRGWETTFLEVVKLGAYLLGIQRD